MTEELRAVFEERAIDYMGSRIAPRLAEFNEDACAYEDDEIEALWVFFCMGAYAEELK